MHSKPDWESRGYEKKGCEAANDQCEIRAYLMPKMNLNLTFVLDLRHHNGITSCKVIAEAINRP